MLWLHYFKGYIICRVIIKGFLIHEQVKTNADKIKLRAKIVNLSYKNKEPRYGYLRKSISSLVLDQIVSFSCEIVAHQELFWVAFSATSELSATKTTMETRKYKKSHRLISTINTKRAAHYFADFFAVIAQLTLTCQTWLKWQCDRRFNLYHRRFINLSDSRNFDVVGNTHTEAQFSFKWI